MWRWYVQVVLLEKEEQAGGQITSRIVEGAQFDNGRNNSVRDRTLRACVCPSPSFQTTVLVTDAFSHARTRRSLKRANLCLLQVPVGLAVRMIEFSP